MVQNESTGGAFAKYRPIAELGQGGMAQVFLALASGPAGFNKLVVIKQIREQFAEDPEFLTMFLDEARLAARLNHPNVVQTNEVGGDGRRFYICMEYLEGQPLNRIFSRVGQKGGLTLGMSIRILVDCRDLALIAATLANGGVHPRTGERAVDQRVVDSVLSVMTTCGMYDFAGEWLYAVGMPAKSGVAGGVLAVLPGQLGIGVFSPRLDARGNSVRGVAVCTDLSRDFNLHFLRVSRSARSTLRAEYDLGQMRSRRLRSDPERAALDAAGKRVRIYELQGDLSFAAVETLVRRIVAKESHAESSSARLAGTPAVARRARTALSPRSSRSRRR